mmetsp:Transcript_99836/g.198066  ORF Transcript_99836/g.198066 Transcript_99836/m.198066 type:complete len:118 (+) Transcript_99836:116-469(+)
MLMPWSTAAPDVEKFPLAIPPLVLEAPCGKEMQHFTCGRQASPPKGPKLRPTPFPVSRNLLPAFSMLPDAMKNEEVLIDSSNDSSLLPFQPETPPIELRGATIMLRMYLNTMVGQPY